jgi:hypothetical protein
LQEKYWELKTHFFEADLIFFTFVTFKTKNMKTKILFVLFLSMGILYNTVSAQDLPATKNEIRLGYGVLTGPEMVNSLMSMWPAIGIHMLLDTIRDYRCSFYGVASLEYMRIIKPWLRVGISATVNPISTLLTSKSGFEFSYSYYLFTLMPRVDFYYINKGIFSMYSGIEVGASLILWQDRTGSSVSNDTGVRAAFHINAFGVRVGKDIGAFMEWGYGFRGMVNLGISGRF